jgi:hypothetical protein
MNPFHDVYVLPSYGKKEALIKWSVPFEYEQGTFIIQKSANGVTHWDTIGSGPGLREFIDTDFVVPNKHRETHYRVIIQHRGKRYDSSSVATFDKLAKQEYGLLNRMMIDEDIRMHRQGNGISVAILKQKVAGEPCKCVDPKTEQSCGTTLCEDCYATGIKGGFDDAVFSYVEFQNQKSTLNYQQNGMGTDDKEIAKIRIVAYPELRRGDIVVNPRTDQRYIVNNIEPMKFKGIVPFVYHLDTSMLDRKDVRYKIPVPQLPQDVR